MECVEWEERARADRPAAPVRARRGRTLLLAALATAVTIGIAVATAL